MLDKQGRHCNVFNFIYVEHFCFSRNTIELHIRSLILATDISRQQEFVNELKVRLFVAPEDNALI